MSKFKNLLARCIVKIVDDSEYSLTALSGENITGVEHLQEFGFASKKPSDEDGNGIAVFYGGDRGNASLLVLEVPKFKPDLADGESAVFNAFDALIKLTTAGNIELNGSTNAGIVKIIELTSAINTLVSVFNTHTHNSPYHTFDPTTIPNALQIPLVKTAYENDKVVH